jgi:hypothetical protein
VAFVGKAIVIDSSSTFLYVGGSIGSNPGMTKISLSNGLSTFSYVVENPSGTSTQKVVTNLDLTDYGVQKYYLGCAENLGSDQNDIAILQYSETLESVLALSKSWYFDMAIKTRCLDLESDGSTLYLAFH